MTRPLVRNQARRREPTSEVFSSGHAAASTHGLNKAVGLVETVQNFVFYHCTT